MTKAVPDVEAPRWIAREAPERASIGWLAVCGVCAGLYLYTMAPGVLWGDSGDAQVRVLTGGWADPRDLARAHVTYYALAIGIHRGLGWEAAWAANFVAALAGAVTVANMSVVIRTVVRSHAAWAASVLLLMLSHTLWQLSCGAEVVTVSTALLSCELLLVLRFLRTGAPALLVVAGLVNGLGWATHNLALLTWPAYLVLLGVYRRRLPQVGWRTWAAVVMAWLMGAAALLVLAAQAFAESGRMVETVRSLLVGIYGQKVLGFSIAPGRVAQYLVLNFPTPLLLLAPWGWWVLRRSAGRAEWTLLSVAGATYALFGARYNVPDQYTFLVHAYLFLVVFIAAGIAAWTARFPGRTWPIAAVVLALTGPCVYAASGTLVSRSARLQAALPARVIPHREGLAWFLQPWRMGDRGAAQFAREVLNALPPSAVLYADTTTRWPLDYVQATERLRSDVQLVGSRNRAAAGLAQFNPADVDACAASGLLYSVESNARYLPDWLISDRLSFERAGPVYRVVLRAGTSP